MFQEAWIGYFTESGLKNFPYIKGTCVRVREKWSGCSSSVGKAGKQMDHAARLLCRACVNESNSNFQIRVGFNRKKQTNKQIKNEIKPP